MKVPTSSILVSALLTGAAVSLAEEERTAEPLKVAVELSDGSRIVGIPIVRSLAVKALYGKLELPLTAVSAAVTEDGGIMAFEMRNGDIVKGTCETNVINLTTLLGNISIPIERIVRCDFRPGASPVHGRLASALVLHLAFDRDEGGIATDKSGLNNDGTIHGATWTSINGNGVMSFDGVDDYVELGESKLYQTRRQLGVCAWVNLAREGAYLLSNYHGGSTYPGQFFFSYDSQLQLYVAMGQDANTRVVYHTTQVTPLRLNKWHHVAFSYDEARGNGRKIAIYLDGRDAGRCAALHEGNGGEILATSERIRLMACQDSARPGNAPGMMDEVKIFNRALTLDEVKQIYSAERMLFGRGAGDR